MQHDRNGPQGAWHGGTFIPRRDRTVILRREGQIVDQIQVASNRPVPEDHCPDCEEDPA